MYPNTRHEQESNEDSLGSSFWSDGENQEEEVVQLEVHEDPLKGAAEHELKETPARMKPDLIGKSEGSGEQSSGDGSEGEDLSGGDEREEDESEDGSEEDGGREDDSDEGGSCGEDEDDHGSEGDEEERCSESEKGSPESSSRSGEEQDVEVEEQGSGKAFQRLVEALEGGPDLDSESEEEPSSWSDGGHRERDEQGEDLCHSVESSSEESMDQSSEDGKFLHSSEDLHIRDGSHEMFDQTSDDFKADGYSGEDQSGSGAEDKSPVDQSEDENHGANEDSSLKLRNASVDRRISLDFRSDHSYDDDGDDGDGESEEYDGSVDHSDEEEDSQDSMFWFDLACRDKEEEEQGEGAPGDGKSDLNFQHGDGVEDQSDVYDGSEEESEDGDSSSSRPEQRAAKENVSDADEEMDLDSSCASKEAGDIEDLKEVPGDETGMKFPEDPSQEDDGDEVQEEEEDSFWSGDRDKKLDEEELDEDLEEEKADLSSQEDNSGERSGSSLDSPAPSLVTSGYGTFLPEDQDHQLVTECEEVEDAEHRNQVEAHPDDDGDEGAKERVQSQDPGERLRDQDIKFLDVESSASLEWDGNLRAPQQGAASSLDDRLSQLHLSERLDSELDEDGAARDSDSEQHSLSAFESYVRTLTRSRGDGDLPPKPKSFIRPVMMPTRKKTDPVAKYFQYKQLWDLFKVPGEKDHRELRWAVKERLAYQPPQVKPRRAHVPNAFTVPTDKKRSSLRWRVRTDLANGLIPDQHQF